MVGRKPAISPSVVVECLLLFKERVIFINSEGDKRIVVATDPVWYEISCYLDGRMNGKAIHTFVHRGAYGIQEKLGFAPCKKDDEHIKYENNTSYDGESSECNSEQSEILPTKKFIFTFSSEEWQGIEPEKVYYKHNDSKRILNSRVYYVLPKYSWTPLLAEHFWEHTYLSCTLSFRRAKVYSSGHFYIKVVGKCSSCESYFEGTVFERPTTVSRVLMNCSYSGNFDSIHNAKKRHLIGSAKAQAITAMVNDGKSSESYREMLATRLMKIGDPDPPIIPSSNSLRALKSRKIASTKRYSDTITSLAIMKSEDNFKNIIYDIGSHPFYIHYHSGEQIHMYRKYCSSNSYPQLIIDATSSIIKNFTKFNLEKTRPIFLYEAIIYDAVNKHSTTVSNMLTERHDTISIFNWLAKWLNCNIPQPRQTVCDQSLALLSAITQCFTQYSSMENYIQVCSDLITGQISINSHWVPKCFIRIDVAHFIKLASKWAPLKLAPPRVRELILRTIGLLVKSQTLDDIYTLVLSLFVVLINETNGMDKDNEHETPCEKHYKILITATTTGFVEFQHKFDEIMAYNESKDDVHVMLEEEYECQYDGLSEKNPFKSWAENIYEKSKTLVQEGSGINPMYLPSLLPHIMKCMKLLPLWSGIMVPIFGFGEVTSSSAAMKSSFQKLKNITLKHLDLPMNIESFLKHHILSLRGSSLLKDGQKCRTISEKSKNVDNSINIIHETNDFVEINKCPLCTMGSLSSINGAHKCKNCRVLVHALSSCSSDMEGNETSQVCFNCSGVGKTNVMENTAKEKWKRKQNNNLRTIHILFQIHIYTILT